MFGHVLTHESKNICCLYLLHRSKFFSVQNYRAYLKEMLKVLGLSQVVTKTKPTEAYRNGARLLMKIH